MLPFVEWLFETGWTPDFPMDLPDLVPLRSMIPGREHLKGHSPTTTPP